MNQQEGYQRIDAWHRARKATETTARQSDKWAALHAGALTHHEDARIDPPQPYTPARSVYIKQINNRIDRAIARTDHPGKP